MPLELDAAACRSLAENRNWSVPAGDVNQITSETILNAVKLKKCEADIPIGRPHCPPFSKSGYRHSGDSEALFTNNHQHSIFVYQDTDGPRNIDIIHTNGNLWFSGNQVMEVRGFNVNALVTQVDCCDA